MHLLFLTDNFPPEVNAPASRTYEHCREWVRAGHQVTVITCVPNFPKGKVFPGYRNRALQTETIDGIRVIRVWSYITSNEGFLRRILDYQSFMVTATAASLLVRHVDAVLGTSPQFFTVCAAYVVSCLKRAPFIFELRDLWPASIKAVGAMRNAVVLRALERLEMFLYRHADQIVSVTQSFRQNLIKRGIDASKISVVTNGVDATRFAPRDRDQVLARSLGLTDRFVVGYIGTHGLAHALETLLKAAEMIRRRRGGDAFRFLFLGDGARKAALKAMAGAKGLSNVLFLDSVPRADVPRYWSLLDVSVTHLKRDELFANVIPSKLFESMAMGIPLVHGVRGESAAIVEREGVGLVFESEDAEELCERLELLRNDRALYERCRRNCAVAVRAYGREALAHRMLALIQERIASPT